MRGAPGTIYGAEQFELTVQIPSDYPMESPTVYCKMPSLGNVFWSLRPY